jgi:hypothetical protein
MNALSFPSPLSGTLGICEGGWVVWVGNLVSREERDPQGKSTPEMSKYPLSIVYQV